MIVSINQPAYLPWPGYFDRIDASDLHIVLDHVQFEKNSFVNRNRIRTPQGSAWLTVPVATSGRFGDLPINELRVADGGRWRRKHWAALRANYARSPHFGDHAGVLAATYEDGAADDRFLPPVLDLEHYFRHVLGIKTPVRVSSDLATTATKSDLVLEICEVVGAETYLSGPLGRDYLELDRFAEAGIDVKFHDYEPRPYEQAWPGFEPGMATIDLLANHGPAEALAVIRQGRCISNG